MTCFPRHSEGACDQRISLPLWGFFGLRPQNDACFYLAILSSTVILSLSQNLLEMLKLSWIIRGEDGVTSDPHLTGSALLHPTGNPQVQHDKMEPSLSSYRLAVLSPFTPKPLSALVPSTLYLCLIFIAHLDTKNPAALNIKTFSCTFLMVEAAAADGFDYFQGKFSRSIHLIEVKFAVGKVFNFHN